MKIQEIKIEGFFENIVFLGDIHGQFHIPIIAIDKFNLKNTAIIQVGDFGVGFMKSRENQSLEMLNGVLAETGCKLFAMRGNHDDPKQFNNKWRNSHIFMVDDWTILDMNIHYVEDHRILCVGGAVSIDRIPSKFDGMWFEGEEVRWDDDVTTFDKLTGITVMCTHTAPDFIHPVHKNQLVYNFAANDDLLLEDLDRERRLMTYLYNCIKEKNKETLTQYYYGHFHSGNTDWIDDVRFKLLAVNEICEIL